MDTDFEEIFSRCRDIMPLPDLMEKLGKGAAAKSSARSPFREDNNPSFGIYQKDGRWKWKDHATGEGGDELDFLMKHEGCEKGQAMRFYKDLAGIIETSTTPVTEIKSVDWAPYREAFTQDRVNKLSEQRALSPAFCNGLVSKNLIGITNDGCVAFPAMDQHGQIIAGTHRKTPDGKWSYTDGVKAGWYPYVMGDIRTAQSIYFFESQWDAMSAADSMEWLADDTEAFSSVAFVSTRGAKNTKVLTNLPISNSAKVVIVPQHDKAGEEWVVECSKIVREKYQKSPYLVSFPETYKDINDWAKSGKNSLAIARAIENPQRLTRGTLPPPDDGTSFVADNIPVPMELVAGVLHKGTKMVLGGPSKAYKTWALLDLAVSVATGKDWWGFPCVKGKVIYLNFEIPRPFMRKRLEAVLEAKGVKLEPGQLEIWNLRGHAGSFEKLLSDIIDQLKDGEYVLCIIDPTYKVMGDRDENSASDMNNLMNTFEQLCHSTGVAVAFGSHFAKGNASGKEAIDRISGSGVTARDPDSILTLTRHSAGDAYFTADFTLRNFPRVDPFVLMREHPLMIRCPDLDPNDLKQPDRMQKDKSPGRRGESSENKEEKRIAKLLKTCRVTLESLTHPMTPKEWMEKCEKSDIPKRTHENHKKALREEGFVIHDEEKGLWSRC